MKILLTNDDGIEAEGLKHLVEWAKTLGEVTVFAPKFQQSAMSHSIQIHSDGFEVKRSGIFGDIEAYSVDSTPADCVRVAVLGMKKQFDLALSGINNGPNLGGDIHYSGTVAACFEAALLGIRAMAVSAAFNSLENAVKNLDRAYREIMARRMLEFSEIVNVNFPEKGEEILVTKMGPAIYTDSFEFLPGDLVKPHLVSLYRGTSDLTLDTDAVMTGHISLTPLRCDLTEHAAYDILTKKVG